MCEKKKKKKKKKKKEKKKEKILQRKYDLNVILCKY